MKSLKAYRNIQTGFNTTRQTETVIAEDYEGYCIEFKEDDEVYLKSEADKVIADLEKKLDLYKRGFKEDDKINAYLYAELRHQKYERCIDKANYWVAISYHCVDDKHRQRAKRHHRKWLEIAKQFKEAK